MKVIAVRDIAYRHDRIENGRSIIGDQILPAGTILDVVPMTAAAINAVATDRDDLREIARFTRLEKQFGMEIAKVPWKRRLAGPADVLISWGGQIRFVTIGDEVRVVS